MEWSWAVCVTAILFSAIVLGKNRWRNKKWRNKRSTIPLGTFGLPFVGETLQFICSAYSNRLESFMDNRRRKYGKVFTSHIFGSPTIVSQDAELNKLVLQSDTTTFVSTYPKSLHDLLGESSVLFMTGSRHRRFHGLIGSFFKSPTLKVQVTRDMEKYVKESMSRWKDNHLIYIQDETKHIALRVHVEALINLDLGEEIQLLMKQVEVFVDGFISLPINLPGSQLYRSLQAKKKILKLVRKVIEERKKIGNSSAPKDVLDVLLNDSSEQFSLDQIADNMVELMPPGEDSVPALMTLLVKYLSDCSRALKQLTEENMELKRKKRQLEQPLSWSDYMSLSFTQDVITETLRMGSLTLGTIRKATKDIDLKGYHIPKGWCVLTFFKSVHLDETIHELPYEFNPWRWQNQKIGPQNFSPFGGGERLCPGRDLARLEASIFLYHLVTQFSWDAEDDSIVSFPTVRMKRRMPVWVKRIEGIEF